MGKALNTIIKLRSDASTNWLAANPILQAGEPGVEIDTLRFKIGNGVTTWENLPYISGGSDEGTGTSSSIMIVDTLPAVGSPSVLYKVEHEQKFYFWNTLTNSFDLLNSTNDIPTIEDTNTDNIIVLNSLSELPEKGEDNYLYKTLDTQKLYFWDSNAQNFSPIQQDIEIPEYIDTNTDNIVVVSTFIDLPAEGKENYLYKAQDEQKFYFYNPSISAYEYLSTETQIPEFEDKNTDNIVPVESTSALPIEGQDNLLYKTLDEQKFYFWNSNELAYNEFTVNADIEIPEFTDTNTDNLLVIEDTSFFPETGEDNILYKTLDTQTIYFWNSNTQQYEILKGEVSDFVDTNTDNIQVVDKLPEIGEENILYKVSSTQSFYFWNAVENTFMPLITVTEDIIPEVKGGIEIVDTLEDLPAIGESDMLYKVLADEYVYTWNASTNEYAIVAGSSSSAAGGGIVVVDTFADLPEIGSADTLYKVLADQLLYNYNTLNSAYEPLGQSGGTAEEGFNITIQSTIDRIFAAIKGDPVLLSFRYSSVDAAGLNDGPGIGTLYVNEVKKATVAIPQKLQDLDITDYLTLGENNVSLYVENSEGAEKAKTLVYSIELVDLYLTSNIKAMDIYDSETVLPFQITGSGTKTLYYHMDGELLASEEITSTNVYSHTFRVPMQEAGDHILKIHAEREVNNMIISSNTLTFGMMYITNEMVDTFILSNFEQTKSVQGEIITIPYLVYNPFLETANVILTIYNEDGSTYFTKEITVDQTVQNWVTQDYPAGKVMFEIQAHSDSGIDAVKQFTIDIEPSTFDLSIIRDSLALEFTAAGRSNAEANPEHWEYYDEGNDIIYTGEFERFAWSGADGWVESDAGETVLRLLPKNKFTIPFYPFKEDKRSTGYTIEIELETRDVANQDAIVLSCMSGGRGIQVNAQQVLFKSALAETSMYFKEDERVRITIVVEASTQDRVIYMFINGIICAATTYEENDNFQQTTPVPITIGSDDCGIDIYKLRFYNRSFSFKEQLENYMCDRSTNAERFEIKERNDIYDISNNITIGSLPPEIPYMVLQCEELPQYKGDKKKKKSCYFVDQLRPERCFSATGVQFDVQGTSSAGYPIKNFKVKFGDGIVYNDGTTADGYPIVNDDDLISKCLCLKADYASSEQANNVILVDFYDEVVRDYFLTPPQELDPKVRTGISGRPIVVFWENTTTGEITFQGQYNMNNDKSNENVFGFDRDIYPQLECWEFCNNTSDRCLFKESEYEEMIYDEEKDEYSPAWMADFEPRFPDLDETYSDYTNYKRLTDWVVSTRQDQATGDTLTEAVTYGDTTYTTDTAEYRLAKFKYEFEDYFIKEPVIFYYIFTEVFLMIDNRAKNMFLTSFDGAHWFPIPYDFDTAIGINNEGKLVFDYDLEDTDYLDNAPVYNGQESTLWINVRQAFLSDIYEMYDKLRTSGKFSYEVINEKMNKHQEECWPESIWNEDAKLKYVDVYLNTGTNYLEMCQGNKKTQREWWLYNTFKYRDSKYRTGDAQKIIATFRAYAPDDMYITPYQHLWPRVDFTDSYPVTQRSKKNVVNKLANPLDTANDTEMFIRSADRISSFGDLSKYLADTVNFAAATKLQDITLGSSEEGYTNYKLSSLAVGNNRLLTYLNVENCTALNKAIDVSQCFNLETIDAFGSALPSITLPAGGHLMNLRLPATISNFEIKNQHMIESFEMESYDNLETLVIDDTPGLPIEDLLTLTPNLNCVRIVNTTWNCSSEEVLKTIFEKLKTCIGKDVNGNNTEKSVVTGQVHLETISDAFLEELNDYYPELIIYVNGKARFFMRYLNWNNDLLYKYAVSTGDNAIDPVKNKLIDTPTKEGTEDTSYSYKGWSSLPTNVQGPQNMVALYNTQFRVQFMDGDDNVINTQWITAGEDAVDPIESGEVSIPTKTADAQYTYVFAHWNETFTEIVSPVNITPNFTSILRQYPVYFYNDDTLLQESKVYYGNYATYDGDTAEIKKNIGGVPSDYYEFASWSPSMDEPITGTTYFYAQYVFDGYIEDDWATIVANVSSGNVDNYGYGGRKTETLNYTSEGVTHEEEVEFEIVGKHHDILEVVDPSYCNGSTTAGLTLRCQLSLNRSINSSPKVVGSTSGLNVGGWELSEIREWLNGEFLECLPEILQANIKSIVKTSDGGYGVDGLVTTNDKVFLASLEELNISNSSYTDLGQGTPYVLFTDNASRKSDNTYWTRSTYPMTHIWCIIDLDGRGSYSGGGNVMKVIFFICI